MGRSDIAGLIDDAANLQAFNALVEAMRGQHSVALVGAGSSARLRYPLWSGFADLLAAEVVQNHPAKQAQVEAIQKHRDLLFRIGRLRDELGEGNFAPWFRETFGPKAPSFDSFHENIVRLPFRHVLTTNYDPVLDLAHATVWRGSESPSIDAAAHVVDWSNPDDVGELLTHLNDPKFRRRYVHLHGRYNDRRTLVLTRDEYRARYHENTHHNRLLTLLFGSFRVVAIGFGFLDLDLLRIFEDLRDALGPGRPLHFGLLPLGDPNDIRDAAVERDALREKYGVEPVFYPWTPDHGELASLILSLRERTVESPASSGPISPKPRGAKAGVRGKKAPLPTSGSQPERRSRRPKRGEAEGESRQPRNPSNSKKDERVSTERTASVADPLPVPSEASVDALNAGKDKDTETGNLAVSPSERQLFVLWHNLPGGQYYVIAQLECRIAQPRFTVRYLPAFHEAHERGLMPLPSFPDTSRVYSSDTLFPFFRNRLKRRDATGYAEYVQRLDLDPASTDEVSILARSGGEYATDALLILPNWERISPNRYSIYFWASDTERLTGDAWSHMLRLEPMSPLTLKERAILLHDGFAVGRLPEHIDALLLRYAGQGLDLINKASIRVIRRNPPTRRQMLLCRLDFYEERAIPSIGELGKLPENSIRVGARTLMPRPICGERLPHPLENLVIHLSEGNLPTISAMPRPVGGTLYDKPLFDPAMRLSQSPDGRELQLSGTSRQQYLSFLPLDFSQRQSAYLDLEDGSTVHAESIGTLQIEADWQCQLRSWHWARSESTNRVRFWVGLLGDSSLDFPRLNLGVRTLHSDMVCGLHIPGTPNVTLINIVSSTDQESRTTLALIIEASKREQAIGSDIYAATNLLAVTLGLSEPPVFFGYDEAMEVCAYYSRGGLDGGRSTILVPVHPVHYGGDRAFLNWPVPFIRCLRDAVLTRPILGLHEALVWFRFALEEPYLPGQVAKTGIAVRLVLKLAVETSLSQEGWLVPQTVNEALVRMAQNRRLHLPDSALDALALSHRMALLGDAGISNLQLDVRTFYSEGEWLLALEALRTLFATLLAGVVRYYGPVANCAHAIRSRSTLHDPWLPTRPDLEKDKAVQEREALARFVAGEPPYWTPDSPFK